MTPATAPRAADAAYLTDVLRRCGVLGSGRVRAVAVGGARTTILSYIARLRLSCSDAPGAASSLIRETTPPDRRSHGFANAARQEAAFYSEVATRPAARLVPRCFEARWDEDTADRHILLEDLGGTHVIVTEWPLPPRMDQSRQILAARARFRAAWWNEPGLGVSVGSLPDADASARHVPHLVAACVRFADRLGDRLTQRHRALFERFLDAVPRLRGQGRAHRDRTVVRCDAHAWNCFLPRAAGRDDVRLFDWDSWRIGPGSDDLASMMAVHWPADLQHGREQRLLDHHHAVLVAEGVGGYGRGDLD